MGVLGAKLGDPHGETRYGAIFRVGQPYDLNVLHRMSLRGAVLGFYMLDTISIDCSQLYSTQIATIWQLTFDHADLIVTNSDMTRDQFARRFKIPPNRIVLSALHSLDVREYVAPHCREQSTEDASPHILVVGNDYPHKFVAATVNALSEALPKAEIVVLGLESARARERPGRKFKEITIRAGSRRLS